MHSIVVTGAGSSTAIGVIKGLTRQHELPVRVVACDAEELCAGAHMAHAFYKVPRSSDPGYLDEMLRVCVREKAYLLLPIVDAEFMTLARERPLFDRHHVKIAVSNEETLAVCEDKILTARMFQSLRLQTPPTWIPDEREPDPHEFPLILKPRVGGRASMGVHKVHDRDEYDFHLVRAGNCIVQRFIEGDEYTVDTLSDFRGRVISIVPRRRLEVRSGISYKGIVVRDERIIAQVRMILEELKIIGAACIQCIRQEDQIHFIEVNPRFGGATAFTIAGAGVNTPLMLARAARGETVDPCIGLFEENVTLLRYWDEVVIPAGRGGRGRSWA